VLVCITAFIMTAQAPTTSVVGLVFPAQPSVVAAQVFLPLVVLPPSPEGIYNCNEYEFGLIWTTDVITLSHDMSSAYEFIYQSAPVITGTWTYTPTTQEVALRNFHWPIVTFHPPDGLSQSSTITNTGKPFEVGIWCGKVKETSP